MASDPKRFSGELHQINVSKKNWAFILPFFLTILSFIPIHRDSKRGRSRALQIRGAFLVVGIICIAFGKSFFIPIGILLCILALIIPLGESTKRGLVASLKTSGEKRIAHTEKVEIELHKKNILISKDGDELNLIRRKKRKIWSKGYAYVGFRTGQNERFWFRASAEKLDWPDFEKNESYTNTIDVSLDQVMELSRG